MATGDKLVNLDGLKAAYDDTVHLAAQALTDAQKVTVRGNLGAEEMLSEVFTGANFATRFGWTSGYVKAGTSDTTVAVDANGDPTITSNASIYHKAMACAPGDRFTVRTYQVATNARPVLFLGAAADGVRPILAMPTAASLSVITAPAGTEMAVFHASGTAINNGLTFYKGIKPEVAFEELYSRMDDVEAALVELAALVGE